MKNVFFLISLMLLAFGLTAQETMEPELIFEGNARIVFNDGTEREGTAVYSCVTVNRLSFTNGDSRPESIRMRDVKEFYINNMHFVKIVPPGIALGSGDVIARRLNPAGYKISLYEVVSQSAIGTGDGNGNIVHRTDRTVYAEFPGMKSPRAIQDLSFSPFHKKVSKLVGDCKPLSGNIAGKKDGYKITMITTPEQKLDIFQRIAEEYQNCM